jgi:cytochrome c biogenesis protein CcdA
LLGLLSTSAGERLMQMTDYMRKFEVLGGILALLLPLSHMEC